MLTQKTTNFLTCNELQITNKYKKHFVCWLKAKTPKIHEVPNNGTKRKIALADLCTLNHSPFLELVLRLRNTLTIETSKMILICKIKV